MKNIILFLLLILITAGCCFDNGEIIPQNQKDQLIIHDDIINFLDAFDNIQTTNDSILQVKILEDKFLNKASIGQSRMIKARNYSAADYISSIRNNPKFWRSIRTNLENFDKHNDLIKNGIKKLKNIYPSLTTSQIYYTIGAHRSPGTGVDNMVLIGSEFALGDTATVTDELKPHLQNYYSINPIDHLEFLIVHEYIHTQQKPMVHTLLCLSLYEGIADLIAQKVTGENSPFKAHKYGPENDEKIKAKFEEDIFKDNAIYNWLWNSPKNDFLTSDLGYYVGSKIASLYYENAKDKAQAIEYLIELDYSNIDEVESLVNSTFYFSKPLNELENDFYRNNPDAKKNAGIKNFFSKLFSD